MFACYAILGSLELNLYLLQAFVSIGLLAWCIPNLISLMCASLCPGHTERVATHRLTTQTPRTNGLSHSHAVIVPGPDHILFDLLFRP
jgi:hypothetical protein